MRTRPFSCVSLRRPSRKPGLGGISRWNGSTMMPASSLLVLADQAGDGLQVVEGGDQHLVAQALGDAGRVRDRLGEVAGPLGRQAHEPVVAHAVVAALEFEDLVAPGVGAREPHGVGVGLRAGADEAHLLGARHRVDDLGGEADAVGVVGEERGALGGHLLHHLDHLGVGVADDHRAPSPAGSRCTRCRSRPRRARRAPRR